MLYSYVRYATTAQTHAATTTLAMLQASANAGLERKGLCARSHPRVIAGVTESSIPPSSIMMVVIVVVPLAKESGAVHSRQTRSMGTFELDTHSVEIQMFHRRPQVPGSLSAAHLSPRTRQGMLLRSCQGTDGLLYWPSLTSILSISSIRLPTNG